MTTSAQLLRKRRARANKAPTSSKTWNGVAWRDMSAKPSPSIHHLHLRSPVKCKWLPDSLPSLPARLVLIHFPPHLFPYRKKSIIKKQSAATDRHRRIRSFPFCSVLAFLQSLGSLSLSLTREGDFRRKPLPALMKEKEGENFEGTQPTKQIHPDHQSD